MADQKGNNAEEKIGFFITAEHEQGFGRKGKYQTRKEPLMKAPAQFCFYKQKDKQ